MLRFLRIQDILDILIMTVLVYNLYRWFRNTKALQVLIGIASLMAVYLVTKNAGLLMTSWILQELGTVFFILIIVIFQREIRQALYRFSLLRSFLGKQPQVSSCPYPDIAQTLFSLASARIGALVVLRREEPLEEHLLHGVPVDSLVNGQLISGIFHPSSPLHDGAIFIDGGRIKSASCHLPLSADPDIPLRYGTRHRAAIGLSERSDALVVVVSEERGEVSLVQEGRIEKVDDPAALARRLEDQLEPSVTQRERLPFSKMLTANLRAKLLTFVLVVFAWAVIVGRQGEIVNITVPVRYHNLPDNLVLLRAVPEEVDLQVKAFSSFITALKKDDVLADVDLAGAQEGTTTMPVRKEDVKLPLGMSVTSVSPTTIRVTAEKKVRKKLRVAVKSRKWLPEPLRLVRIVPNPAVVVVEGPEGVLARLDAVNTEEIDLSEVHERTVVQKKLVPPAPSVRIVPDDSVSIAVVVSPR